MKRVIAIAALAGTVVPGRVLAQQNLLPNPGFEVGTFTFASPYIDPVIPANNRDPNTGAEGWNSFNNNALTPGALRSSAFAHSGAYSIKLQYGATPDFEAATTGFRYNDSASPFACRPFLSRIKWRAGDITVSGWYLIPQSNPIQSPGWTAPILQLFNPAIPFNAADPCDSRFFKAYQYPDAIVGDTGGTWRFFTRTITIADQVVDNLVDKPYEPVAGADTAVRFLLVLFNPIGAGLSHLDAVYWDDVTLTQVIPPCYANCDGSTGAPSLTQADFACFLERFRAGDPYANCDGSTITPQLTAVDFTCFLNAFRLGCP